MARGNKPNIAKDPPAAVAETPEVPAAQFYQDGMVNIRSVGGRLIDPYTNIEFDQTPQHVFVTSWVQVQLDAKKLEVVS